jgi:hypothetical protein
MRESVRDETQWLLNALPLWELHSCKSCKCLEPWLERPKNAKLGPHDTIRKVLKHICLKCLRTFHLDLICMNYDFKKGKNQIGNLTPNHKPLESKGQMSFAWGMLYIVGKIFLKVIKYCLRFFKTNLIWERYEQPKFWDSHLGIPKKSDIWMLSLWIGIKYTIGEGSGASSQRLRIIQRLCLKFSLLSPLHHFHPIYTNCPLFLVVQIDFILNYRLWIHSNPILELQHTLLPLKWCNFESMP